MPPVPPGLAGSRPPVRVHAPRPFSSGTKVMPPTVRGRGGLGRVLAATLGGVSPSRARLRPAGLGCGNSRVPLSCADGRLCPARDGGRPSCRWGVRRPGANGSVRPPPPWSVQASRGDLRVPAGLTRHAFAGQQQGLPGGGVLLV